MDNSNLAANAGPDRGLDHLGVPNQSENLKSSSGNQDDLSANIGPIHNQSPYADR